MAKRVYYWITDAGYEALGRARAEERIQIWDDPPYRLLDPAAHARITRRTREWYVKHYPRAAPQ